MDLSCDDVFFNSLNSESQLLRKDDYRPGRGAKEKSDVLMRLFVHGLNPKDGIVVDLTTSTSNSRIKMNLS